MPAVALELYAILSFLDEHAPGDLIDRDDGEPENDDDPTDPDPGIADDDEIRAIADLSAPPLDGRR